MPVWRCPHCRTPQAEASRCWVCRRSTTSCGTCRHFRRGVAGGLGLCGLDRRQGTLLGSEMRACWAAPGPPAAAGPEVRPRPVPAGQGAAGRTFVPVEEDGRPLLAASGRAPSPVPASSPAALAAPLRPVPGTWWLWGDPEP